MKIHIVSDIHQEFYRPDKLWQPPKTGAEVLILAGDIDEHRRVSWFANLLSDYALVLFVPGNHDYYGTELGYDWAALETAVNVQNGPGRFHILTPGVVTHRSVRFIGATLWTDYRNQNAMDMMLGRQSMRDFLTIAVMEDDKLRALRPEDLVALNQRDRAFIHGRLAEPHDGATIMITHHAPSIASVHPRYRGNLVNSSYYNTGLEYIGEDVIDFWVHGHMHDSCLYGWGRIGTVVCNPKGYMNENVSFQDSLMIEIDEQISETAANGEHGTSAAGGDPPVAH